MCVCVCDAFALLAYPSTRRPIARCQALYAIAIGEFEVVFGGSASAVCLLGAC